MTEVSQVVPLQLIRELMAVSYTWLDVTRHFMWHTKLITYHVTRQLDWAFQWRIHRVWWSQLASVSVLNWMWPILELAAWFTSLDPRRISRLQQRRKTSSRSLRWTLKPSSSKSPTHQLTRYVGLLSTSSFFNLSLTCVISSPSVCSDCIHWHQTSTVQSRAVDQFIF